jgi:hypothetical protein
MAEMAGTAETAKTVIMAETPERAEAAGTVDQADSGSIGSVCLDIAIAILPSSALQQVQPNRRREDAGLAILQAVLATFITSSIASELLLGLLANEALVQFLFSTKPL